MKAVVIYYSRTGNAKFIAEKIAQECNADIEAIVDKKKRTGPVGYMRSGRDASREKETEIAETPKLPQDYELVIVGTPVWAGKITPAVRTYLKRNNLAGKKVAIFVAMG